MTDFEDQLRRALQRKEPSADFAARVVAQASRADGSTARTPWHWWAVGLAASLFVGSVGFELEHRDRARQGEAARTQLLQAMQITSTKLNKIQKKVKDAWR